VSTAEVGAVVVGAGIAGLSAALELQREMPEVVVVDASDRPGGVMRTDHVSGYVVERGPNTFQVDAPLLALLRREGLADSLVRAGPASRRRYLVKGGALVPVPGSLLGLARTPLLSAGAKLRLLSEPLRRRRDASGESVSEFVGRRLGPEVAANLVGPFLTGVYAGDEDALSAAAVFPGLVALERRFGSLAVGGLVSALSRRRERGLPGSHSAVEGLGPLARALAERLVEPPALGNHITSLRRDDRGWVLSMTGSGGSTELRTARVVLAAPAREAAAILRAVEPDAAAALEGIEYAPIVGVPLGVPESALPESARGFGFLVPRGEGLRVLGCLFMSELFHGRAPAGRALLHCMLGGTRWRGALDLPDDVVVRAAAEDLERVLGLAVEPQSLGVARWPRAIPQPGRDHRARVEAVRARVAAFPGLTLAGSYLDGISVADAAASGMRAARELA